MKKYHTKSERLKKRKRNQRLKAFFIGMGTAIIVVEILLLAGVIPMPKLNHRDDTVDTETTLATDDSDALEEQSVDTGTQASKKEYMKYIFVGDSRYVGMSTLAQSGDVFLAKNNMGYDYLLEQMTNIYSACDKDSALIIGLGVNDVNYAVDKYIAKLNELVDQLDCQIYYMSVNPVDEAVEEKSGYGIKNDKIDEFNTKIKKELSTKIKYIDSNSYLKEVGYTTVDGLHYDSKTYQAIYDYIKENL